MSLSDAISGNEEEQNLLASICAGSQDSRTMKYSFHVLRKPDLACFCPFFVVLCVVSIYFEAYRHLHEQRVNEKVGFDEIIPCGSNLLLSRFTSQDEMEEGGFVFNWTDDFTFKPLMYQDFVPADSFWGFRMRGWGAIFLKLHGTGVLSIDFGNMLGTPTSEVSVYINSDKIASAGPSVISSTVVIDFVQPDVLKIVQSATGIIVINNVHITCKGPTLSQTVNDDIYRARENWRQNHIELERAASIAETKEEEHYAAVQLAKAQKEILSNDVKKEETLRSGEDSIKLDEDGVGNPLVNALEPLFDGTFPTKAKIVKQAIDDMKNLSADNTLNSTQKVMRAATTEEKLASEIEKAVQDTPHQGDSHKNLRLAEKLKAAANIAEVEMQSKLEMETSLQDEEDALKKKRHWAEHLVEEANAQERHTAKELRVAEHLEDKKEKESADAAQRMDSILERNGVVDLPTSLADKRAEGKRVHENEMQAKEAVISSIGTNSTTRSVKISLFCYALMLPFGYEPALLATQDEKKVGCFACDEYTVFSNSTTLLDTGLPCPVKVTLVDISLTVPYGGKWHTSLNTPIFNHIWTKVRSMIANTNHDWVVKADPDTVWFPDRLIAVLSAGIPTGAIPPERRLKGKYGKHARHHKDKGRDKCGHCKLRGLENDPCDQHVQWLQANRGMTCDAALHAISEPPPNDCGCKCTRLEACDLSPEHDWRANGRYIKGDYSSPAAQNPAIYINNCRFGLHGPIEVLSVGAVIAYANGLHRCEFLLAQPWGEDKFLDRCMLAIGVTRANVFEILSETACGEEPAPCGGSSVAFHPFKKHDEYFTCWDYAKNFGKTPKFDDADGDRSFV